MMIVEDNDVMDSLELINSCRLAMKRSAIPAFISSYNLKMLG